MEFEDHGVLKQEDRTDDFMSSDVHLTDQRYRDELGNSMIYNPKQTQQHEI